MSVAYLNRSPGGWKCGSTFFVHVHIGSRKRREVENL